MKYSWSNKLWLNDLERKEHLPSEAELDIEAAWHSNIS